MTIAHRLKKAGKRAAVGFSFGAFLVVVYWAVGVYLVPRLIQGKLLPRVSEAIGAELTVEGLAVDPFRAVLKVRGGSLKWRGQEVAAFRGFSADIEAAESFRQRRLILGGTLSEAVARPAVDARGRFNFAFLKAQDQPGNAGFPFLVSDFTLQKGRIQFRDGFSRKPYAKDLEILELKLENLGPEPDRKARFRLAMKSEKSEEIAASGTFSLSPLVSEGELRVAALALPSLLDYLAPGAPVRFTTGQATARVEYGFRSGDRTTLDLRGGEGRIEHPALADRDGGRPWLKLAGLSAARVSYSAVAQSLKLDSLEAREAATPWGKAAGLAARGLVYSLAEQRLKLDSVSLREAAAPVEAPDGADPRAPESTLKEVPRSIRIDSLKAAEIVADLNARTVAVASLMSERAEAEVRRSPDGTWVVTGLPVRGPSGENGSAPGWTFRAGEIRLENAAVGFRDEGTVPPVVLDFAPASLRLTDFSSEPGNRLAFRLDARTGDTGKIEVDGLARLEPLEIDLRFGVDRFRLRSLYPYWQERSGVDLVKGRLNLWGDITVRRDSELKVDYSGGAEIQSFATVDKAEGKPFIGWNSMKFDGLVVNTEPARFAVRSVSVEQPAARVVVGADGELNLLRTLAGGTKKPAAAPASGTSPALWPVVVGLLRVQDGRMDFSDLTLKPAFSTEILGLNGTLGGLSSKPDARASVLLEGRVDRNSPVKIAGQINPFQWANHTDVTMEFRGLNMTTLSPYSGKFAGYRIEKGKLDMNLRYTLHDRKLQSENRVLLDHLVLGERVDSPSATSLPVDLAVALLKDGDGRIDIDLPISGNLDDPEFNLGRLYADALTQFLSKVVGSPLALLGSLVGGGEENLGSVHFRPGDATLSVAEKAGLDKMAEVLKKRPVLQLEVRGTANAGSDRLALAEQELLEKLKILRRIELRAQGAKWQRGALDLAEEDYRRLFTQFYRRNHPGSPELKALAGEAAVLSGVGFAGAKRKVLEGWAVDELDLRRLAQDRARSIRDYLVSGHGLPDQRIYLLAVKLEPAGSGDIESLLSLSGS